MSPKTRKTNNIDEDSEIEVVKEKSRGRKPASKKPNSKPDSNEECESESETEEVKPKKKPKVAASKKEKDQTLDQVMSVKFIVPDPNHPFHFLHNNPGNSPITLFADYDEENVKTVSIKKINKLSLANFYFILVEKT